MEAKMCSFFTDYKYFLEWLLRKIYKQWDLFDKWARINLRVNEWEY